MRNEALSPGSLPGGRRLHASLHACQKREGSQAVWGSLDLRAQGDVTVTQKSLCHKRHWVLSLSPPWAL